MRQGCNKSKQSKADLNNDIDEMCLLPKQRICCTDDKATDTDITEQMKEMK